LAAQLHILNRLERCFIQPPIAQNFVSIQTGSTIAAKQIGASQRVDLFVSR